MKGKCYKIIVRSAMMRRAINTNENAKMDVWYDYGV